jgi:hypothetical protein
VSKPHWSFSQYSEFMQCGHKYYLRRIKKVPTIPSVASVAGRAFHSWTELHDGCQINYATRDTPFVLGVDDWENCLHAAVNEEEERSGLARTQWRVSGKVSKDKPNKEDLDWWLFNGWDMCQKYVDWRSKVNTTIATDLPPDENGNTVGIEYALRVELIGMEFVGYLDRLEYDEHGNLGVRDLKSGGRVWVSVQPGFYSGAARLAGLHLHWWDRYDARKGVTVPDPPRLLDKWDAARVAHMLAQAEDQRSRHIYPVRVGDQCNYCPVRDACDYKM